MGTFSAKDAALAGVRFIRREPAAIAAWAGVYFVQKLLTTLALFSGPEPSSSVTPAERFASAQNAVIVSVLLAVPLSGILWAASTRAFLRRGQDRLAWLRLGKDEVLMVLLVLYAGALFQILSALLTVALIIPAASVGSGIGAIFGASAGASLSSAVLFSRLCPAGAMTLDQQRVRLFSAWPLTRGVWPAVFGLFLAFAVVFGLLGGVPLLIRFALHPQPLASFADWWALSRTMNLGYRVAGALAPLNLLRLAYSSLLSSVSLAVFTGIAVTVYRNHPPVGPAVDA